MGMSRPLTPLVGMAAATIIMVKMVISSPRWRAQPRRHQPKIRCRVSSSTKNRKNAIGVAEVRASEVPWISWRP